MRLIKFVFWLGIALLIGATAWLGIYASTPIAPSQLPLEFSLKEGSSLRAAIRQLQQAGVIDAPLPFELLARVHGDASRLQAGNYEITAALTPLALLTKLTSGEQAMDRVTLIEGWTFAQVRSALASHPGIKHDTQKMTDEDIRQRLSIEAPSMEGWFLPETYAFVRGTSDLVLLENGYQAMKKQLDTLWASRDTELPLETPYQALVLASIIEKETGQASERSQIAAVFVNRLRIGMPLQTDPTIIYGLGARFDGNLRKRDLLTDGPYNTYLRAGLPPTPIALPGPDALAAAFQPATSDALYFVARGDGTSEFSATLAEHERAVTKYQRQGRR